MAVASVGRRTRSSRSAKPWSTRRCPTSEPDGVAVPVAGRTVRNPNNFGRIWRAARGGHLRMDHARTPILPRQAGDVPTGRDAGREPGRVSTSNQGTWLCPPGFGVQLSFPLEAKASNNARPDWRFDFLVVPREQDARTPRTGDRAQARRQATAVRSLQKQTLNSGAAPHRRGRALVWHWEGLSAATSHISQQ